jgi:hypothetical protein
MRLAGVCGEKPLESTTIAAPRRMNRPAFKDRQPSPGQTSRGRRLSGTNLMLSTGMAVGIYGEVSNLRASLRENAPRFPARSTLNSHPSRGARSPL